MGFLDVVFIFGKSGVLRATGNDFYVFNSGDIPRGLGDPDPNPGVVTEPKDTETPSVPPESTFVKLAPSKNRYTLLKDEL